MHGEEHHQADPDQHEDQLNDPPDDVLGHASQPPEPKAGRTSPYRRQPETRTWFMAIPPGYLSADAAISQRRSGRGRDLPSAAGSPLEESQRKHNRADHHRRSRHARAPARL